MTGHSRLPAFLLAADAMVEVLRHPVVAERWTQPSALAQMSVGDLAAHVAANPRLVAQAARRPTDDEAPIPLLDHYARSAWVGADLGAEANTGIRESAQQAAQSGADQIVADVLAALADLGSIDTRLPATARMPWWDWSLSFEDFLVVRTMETVVHIDDLAVSIGIAPPALPETVLEPVLTLLVMLSVRRNGQAAVVRALTRRERADQPINAL